MKGRTLEMTKTYIFLNKRHKKPQKQNHKKTPKNLLEGTTEGFSSRFNKKTGSNQVYPNQNMISEIIVKYLDDEYC